MQTDDRLSDVQKNDRIRANDLVRQTRRIRKAGNSDRDGRDERPSIGTLEGKYYNSPRADSLFVSAFIALICAAAALVIFTLPVLNYRFALSSSLACATMTFIFFDILRGGGRDTHWQL